MSTIDHYCWMLLIFVVYNITWIYFLNRMSNYWWRISSQLQRKPKMYLMFHRLLYRSNIISFYISICHRSLNESGMTDLKTRYTMCVLCTQSSTKRNTLVQTKWELNLNKSIKEQTNTLNVAINKMQKATIVIAR